MTPERIAELRELNQVYGETWFFHPTLGELLDALESAQQEIADLKRGGVVVPEPSIDDDEAILKSLPAGYEFDDGPIPLIHAAVAWARERSRPIPADRVLGEGMVAASQAYIDALENAANQFCGACREKPTCSLGIMAIGKGCGAWRLDAQRINALRAQPTQEPTT